MSMKTYNIMKPIRDTLKHSALALAVCAGLGIGSAQATTTTNTYDLGPSPTGTRIEAGTGGLLPWIAKGTLPPGSILRSVSVNAIIEAADIDSWASDISAYIDPTPEVPGTAALLQVGGYGKIGTVTKMIGWANGQNGPVNPVSDTKTSADWSGLVVPFFNLGDVDLSTAQLSVGNDYGGATWSGTITVEYDIPEPARIFSFGIPGSTVVIDQGLKTISLTVPYDADWTNLMPTYTLSSGTCDKDNGGPTGYDFSNSATVPVVYTVTDSGASAANSYDVTVTLAPPPTPISFGPTTGTGTLAFGTLPSSSEWSTATLPEGGGTTALTLEEMDTYVNTLTASTFSSQLLTVAGNPTGTSRLGQWNSTDLRLTTRATGPAACIMATLSNDSGVAVNELDISFILSGSGTEELPGYVLYYSLTGATASWQRIGSFSTPGAVTLGNIPLSSPWTDGTILYMLWVDDNGNGVTDDWFAFDDVNIAPSVPLTAPIGLTATPGDAKVDLAWSALFGATGYNVKLWNGASYDTISTNQPGTTYTHSGLTNGDTYQYVVSAMSGGVESDNSAAVTATPVAPPTPPGGVTDLALWLDASSPDTMTLDGTTVNEWRDKLGSTAKMTSKGGAPALVASGIGSVPTVHFNNSSWMNDSVNHSAPVTILYVSRETGGSNERVLGACDNNWLMGYHGGQRNRFYFEGWVNEAGSSPDTNPHLYAATIGGSGQNSTVWAEGVELASNQNGQQGPNNLELNGYGSGGELSDCDISEVLVYNRVLTSNELDAVGGYLANKYNLDTAYPPPTPQAKIKTFGPGAVVGPVVDNAADIAWIVPNGTNPATLTPTFTLSAGASCTVGGLTVTSGDLVDFTTNPRHFIVTSSDSAIVNDYTVTVTEAPVETTLIWNTGSGAWDLSTPSWKGEMSGVVMPFLNGVNVIFDDTATGGTVSIAADMSPLSTTVSNRDYTFSGNPIAAGPLTKSGGGTLRLDVTPANFSSIAVNGGTLYLYAADHYHSDSAPFNMGTGTVTVESGATLMGERANMAGSNLIMNGGTWWEDNGFGGSWTGPVYLAADSFFGQNGWCQNQTINGEISGPGGFTFSTQYGAVLTLAVSNSYGGPTTVTGGTLKCNVPDALGSGALSISTGAKVNLNYTGTKTIASLTLGGVAKLAAGTYGSVDSGADFKSAYFIGTGTVTVISLTPQAFITAFGTNVIGSTVVIGDPVGGAANIAWFVPNETDLATVAPTFTMSSGATCDQPSGYTPDPDFSITGAVHYIVKASDYDTSGVTTDYTVTVTAAPYPSPGGVGVLPVCWYDAGNGVTADGGTGVVSAWDDISGYGHHGTVADGTTPILVADQLNALPAIQFRADYLNTAGSMFTAQQYLVIKSPTMTWTGGGTFLGPNNVRIYDMFNGTWEGSPGNYAGFWTDPAPFAVSRDGTPVAPQWGNNFGYPLHPPEIDAQYFLLKIDVNTTARAGAGEPQIYQIGRSADVGTVDFDVVEIIGFDTILSKMDENKLGVYIAGKYGLTIAELPISAACDLTAFGTNVTGSSAAITTTSPTTGTITLTVAPGTTELEVAALAPTYTLSAFATCDQPNGGVPDPALSITGSVPYVVTAEDGTTTKTYTVTVIVGTAPVNDNFANAIDLPGDTGTKTGTGNNYATKETDEPAFLYTGPDFEQSVWFKWTAPSNGNFTVDTYGSLNVAGQDWDSVIYLYDGAALASLNPLATVDNGQAETATIAVTAGTTYYVRLAWGGGPTGNAATQRDTPDIHLNWSFVGSGGVSYADWALANGVTGAPNEDSNNDGVANGIAYFMGETGIATNPGLDASNKVTWPMSATFSGSWQVQTSSDLSNWIAVDPQPTPAGGNLTYTLPPGLGKQFVRLLVTPTP